MNNKAHFDIDCMREIFSLYWDTIPRPIEVKKLPSGYWAVIIGAKRRVEVYPTARLAKIALAEIVWGKLQDQVYQMRELLDTLESEEKEREII